MMKGPHIKSGMSGSCQRILRRRNLHLAFFQCIFLVCCPIVVQNMVFAQEAPFLQAQKFGTDVDIYRTDVCERQKQLYEGKVLLREALIGLDLTVAMTNYKGVPNEEYFFALGDDGKIKEKDSGLFVVILDELARRAGFQWRHSFVAIPPLESSVDGNKTWTDLLVWEVEHFDIAADYWGRSTQRMALGVSFPKGWYDGSVILSWSAAKKSSDDNFWGFLLPFSGPVWLAVCLAIIFTGLAYFLLERLNVESDERRLEREPLTAIFLASITFTRHFEFKPQTHPARLLTFSWTLWALIMASAYTANLASFLVSRNQVDFSVNTLEEALKSNIPVCVQRYSVMDEIISSRYPDMIIVRKETESGIFMGMREDWYGASQGCGVGVTNLGTFQLYQRNKDINYDCSLTTQKRVVQNLPAGFATMVDTGIRCTSLVSYVLNLHMNEMIADGFVAQAWSDHLNRISSTQCGGGGLETPAGTGTVGNFSLSLEDMAGIFILHAALSMFAILFALVDLCKRSRLANAALGNSSE